MIPIEQVAEKVGVAPSTLSTWEGLARIRPEFRRAWIRRPWVRYYSPVQVLQFQAIAELRARGLPITQAVAQSDELVVEWWRLTARAAKHRPGADSLRVTVPDVIAAKAGEEQRSAFVGS